MPEQTCLWRSSNAVWTTAVPLFIHEFDCLESDTPVNEPIGGEHDPRVTLSSVQWITPLRGTRLHIQINSGKRTWWIHKLLAVFWCSSFSLEPTVIVPQVDAKNCPWGTRSLKWRQAQIVKVRMSDRFHDWLHFLKTYYISGVTETGHATLVTFSSGLSHLTIRSKLERSILSTSVTFVRIFHSEMFINIQWIFCSLTVSVKFVINSPLWYLTDLGKRREFFITGIQLLIGQS